MFMNEPRLNATVVRTSLPPRIGTGWGGAAAGAAVLALLGAAPAPAAGEAAVIGARPDWPG
jgi:hypothetical protein